MIDNNTEIFISYSWGGESEQIANEIDDLFSKKGITIIRDKRNLKYKANVDEFMNTIGKGKFIILVISNEYLTKRNCMYELIKIAENDDWYDRVYPIILENTKIYKAIDRIEYTKFWSEALNELNNKVAKYAQDGLTIAEEIESILNEIKLFKHFKDQIDNLTDTFRRMNTQSIEAFRSNNYQELFNSISNQNKIDKSGERCIVDITIHGEMNSISDASNFKENFKKKLEDYFGLKSKEIFILEIRKGSIIIKGLFSQSAIKKIIKSNSETLFKEFSIKQIDIVSNVLVKLDFRESNLKGISLANENLAFSIMQGVNLEGANLSGSILRLADLRNANLTKTNIQRADLRGANLSGATLLDSNLSGTNLIETNFESANLENANLENANLENANLQNANLQNANFIGANLKNALIDNSILEKLRLTNIKKTQLEKTIHNLTPEKSFDSELELTIEIVEEVLKKVRPYLQIDGGDVEVSGLLEGGIVQLRLLGSCKECPLSMMTLRAGIERALMNEIPSIKRIEAVK